MLYAETTPAKKHLLFRESLASGFLLQFPEAFKPLSAKLFQRKGCDGVYIFDAVLHIENQVKPKHERTTNSFLTLRNSNG